jgi:membrane protease YdiL (CAAX protease family)
MRLINSIVFNQCFVLILSVCVAYAGSSFFGYHVSDLHWNGGEDNAFRSFFDWQLTPLRLVEGILATIPMIALAHSIEQSEQREAMEVNFSTINMVISLFGRRKSEHDQTGSDSSEVMALSCGVGVSTAISEEIIFRGLLPTFILSLVHSIPVAMAGQAALFAAGHLSPHAKPDENRLVGSLQFANGLWYGLVYLLAGGDILPCIIAHMLYDVHTLCGTYKKTNDQMDYTEQASHYKTPEWEQREIHKMQLEAQGGDALLGPETVEFARRFFFAFDHDHAGSLSRNDVQKACCYAFLQDEVIPDKTRIDELFDKVKREQNQTSILDNPGQDGRLSFPDFLKLLFILRSASA